MPAMPTPLSNFRQTLWLTGIIFAVFAATFAFYVRAEKQIDQDNESRLRSLQLAGELRQSSDDLTRMVRTYVVTGELFYKQHYQEILAERDGKIPRPINYYRIYWDLVLSDGVRPRPGGEAVPLLDLMRQAGFADAEFAKLSEAKSNSDALTRTELAAMQLTESATSTTDGKHQQAIAMLHDAPYHLAKTNIMRPIAEFEVMSEQRSTQAVRVAEKTASWLRAAVILLAVFLALLVLNAYRVLKATLGGTPESLLRHMKQLGNGEFSSPLVVADKDKNSVMGWLLEMQSRLRELQGQRQEAVSQLLQREARLRAIIDNEPECIKIVDRQGRLQFMSPAGLAMIEANNLAQVQGQPVDGLIAPEFRADFARMHQRVLAGESQVMEFEIIGLQGARHWMETHAVPLCDGDEIVQLAITRNISERKKNEAKIDLLAFYDPLTGLPNRTLLLDRLRQALAASTRSKHYGALLFIDLDNFKVLNDTKGHDAGDLLLKQVAERLRHCVRSGDTAARVGGDEFVVVLCNLGVDQKAAVNATQSVAEKILQSLNQNYQIGNLAHHSTVSIGVTLLREEDASIDDLMKQADLAMYRAKDSGRSTVCFYDPSMQAAIKARAELEDDLRQALDQQQFVLYYQAQVVGDAHVTGAEVLLRWQHPQRDMVSPADFISLAEDTDLIVPIGLWVLESACLCLKQWSARPEFAHLSIAVNVSAKQFNQPDFVTQVLAVIKQTGANPHRLKLELTESLLVSRVEEVIEKMFALKAKGIGFSLDDFGTGYSSLAYLKRLPLDQLKIDQSFVRDVLSDPNDAAIARTVVALAQSLGLAVIAEGVETVEQKDFLASVGCHAYQGYHFARPVPLADFEQVVLKQVACLLA